MGDRLADVLRGAVMRLADEARIEQAGGRGERIDRRIHAFRRHAARQHDRGIEVAEDLGHRRIGEIVGRDIDRLDRGDRRSGNRGDALLEFGDLGGEGRLVADARRQPAEQSGHLAAGLHQAIDVVDQQKHVLVRRVAEVLGDRERRQAGPPARSGRLVHLPEYQCGALQHAGLPELQQQLMPLARAFADPGEDRNAGVALDRRADQLHDQHGLADPGAAEHRRLAAGDQRREQVDDLDAGMENLAYAALAVQAQARARGSGGARSRRSRGGPRSTGFPSASSRRPSTFSPTGTEIGVPSARAAVPRFRPDVGPSATARALSGPTCCRTSIISIGPTSQSTAIASSIAGSLPSGKIMSTTEP